MFNASEAPPLLGIAFRLVYNWGMLQASAKCRHGIYDGARCSFCTPPSPWAAPDRYSLSPTPWGIEILLDHLPIYSFFGDKNFRLNKTEVRLALACLKQLNAFARGEHIPLQRFTGDTSDGFMWEPGDWSQPYLALLDANTRQIVRLGRHKSWAVVMLASQLGEWASDRMQ